MVVMSTRHTLRTEMIIFLFSALKILSSCSVFSNDTEPTDLEKLPPATMSGQNTFGCLVNGKAFIPLTSIDLQAIFQQGQLQFGAQVYGDDFDQIIYMNLTDPLVENQVYIFEGETYHCSYTKRVENAVCNYEPEDVVEGHVLFTNIDRINWIISGTFEFSITSPDCDTVYITDGRFDLEYIP